MSLVRSHITILVPSLQSKYLFMLKFWQTVFKQYNYSPKISLNSKSKMN